MPVALLLAAGQSRRFGSNKLLYEITLNSERHALIVHSLRRWLQAFKTVHLLVDAKDLALFTALECLSQSEQNQLKLIEVIEAGKGMGQSVSEGVAATSSANGWIIGLADMPLVPVSVLQQIHTNLISGASLTAPYYRHQRGHPVGFGKSYQSKLLELEGDEGGRGILKGNLEKIVPVQSFTDGILLDVDVPQDLAIFCD